jgi:cytochrome b561
MTTLDTAARPLNYDSISKSIHWTMALLIPTDWVLAIVREGFEQPTRGNMMFVHKSIGLLIVALLVLRIVWRLTHTAPATEKTPFEPWSTLAAKAGHGLLYLLMIGVPLGGIMASLTAGRSLPFFGLFEIASPLAQNKDLSKQIGEMHELFAHLLMLTVFGHAVVGIIHHVVFKDRTLMKMRPFARD